MMTKALDLVGKKFGRWTATARAENIDGRAAFECVCECGTKRNVLGKTLNNGHSKSCGCLIADAARLRLDDITGETFGALTVIKRGPNSPSNKMTRWWCECTCGSTGLFLGAEIKSGKTKSCGCLRPYLCSIGRTKHGYRNTRVYNIWKGMRHRCRHPSSGGYEKYGAKGVTVCDRWYDSFADFLKDMGEPPTHKHTIDRIDVRKGYSPDNCRWADKWTQANNKTTNISYDGKTIAEWARALGVNYESIRKRMYAGMTLEDAVKKKFRPRRKP